MTLTKSTDLTRGKLEITAYLNKTTGQPEFFVPESQLVLNLAAATQLLKSNSDKIILLNGVKRSCLDDFILRDEAFRDDNAFVINTKHTENGRLVCSVNGQRIAIRDAAADAIEAHHSKGLITVLRSESNRTCVLSENFMTCGTYHVKTAIQQFGEGAPVKGAIFLDDETCQVHSPEEIPTENNLNAESNSELLDWEIREEKRSKAREITAKLNEKLQTLPLENLTLTAPDGITRTVPKKEIYFVTFFTPEPQLELINDDGITFAKFSSAADAQAALDKFNENNSETETNSDVPLAYPQAFQKFTYHMKNNRPVFGAVPEGYVSVTKGEIEIPCLAYPQASQKFTYHMKNNRPVFGAVPEGYVSVTKGEIEIPCKRSDGTISPAKKTVFNTLVYDRPLTDEEILDYDLVPNPFNPTEKTLSELPKSEILNELEPEFFDKYPRCAEIADTINEIVDDISDVDLLIRKAEAKGDIAEAERLKNYNVERGVEIENLECELGLQGTTSPQEVQDLTTRLKATEAEKYVATLRTCDHENELFKECDSLEEAGKFICLNVSAHHQPEIRFDGWKIEHGGAIVYYDFDGEKVTCPELEAAFAKWTAAFEDDNPPPKIIPFPENKVADSGECEGYDEEAFDLLPSLEELNDPETEVEKVLNKLEELQGETAGVRPSEDYAKWRELQRREEDLLSRLIWLQPLSEGEAEVVKPESKLMKLVKLRLKVDEARWKVVRAKMEFEAAMEECLALEREAYDDAG